MSEAAIQKERARAVMKQSWMIGTICFLLAIILIVGFAYRNKEKESRLKELMAHQAITDESIFRLRSENASLIASYYREKIRHLDDLSKEYYLSDSDSKKDIVFKQFKEFLATLDDQSFYKSLENDLDRYCNGIMKKLRVQVPHIQGRNYNITMLFFAGLSYETVSIITHNSSINSLRVLKSRLRIIIEESNAEDTSLFLEKLESKKQ